VGRIVHHGKFRLPMSALFQKQTLENVWAMSALPSIADIDRARRDVRFVPEADVGGSIDHLIGALLKLG
jgi:hypothetical protein